MQEEQKVDQRFQLGCFDDTDEQGFKSVSFVIILDFSTGFFDFNFLLRFGFIGKVNNPQFEHF